MRHRYNVVDLESGRHVPVRSRTGGIWSEAGVQRCVLPFTLLTLLSDQIASCRQILIDSRANILSIAHSPDLGTSPITTITLSHCIT